MAVNRPRGRQRNITGEGKAINRRGAGLGMGSVGNSEGYQGRSGNSGGGKRNLGEGSGSSKGGFVKILVILLILLFGGGSGIGTLLDSQPSAYVETENTNGQGNYQESNIGSLYGHLNGGTFSSGWDSGNTTGRLNASVAEGAREKYTDILGNKRDEATIMVYLCGTDLESRSKMATSDLKEMLDAEISEDINLLVYTGGCKQWQNNLVSSENNQIWKIEDGDMVCLEENLGNLPMTDPDTLSSFIQWCASNFPANRNSLIFWDHGGGSVSGFGYDEKNAYMGSMTLAQIDKALADGGVQFDFVGFDACLMATAENALMLSKYADYMIASEETEPGIGWYYTNWLTKYSRNTSMPTIEIGKNIIDDFIDTCGRKCSGQSTTLSIVDLAELETTVPETLAEFSIDTCDLIKEQEYALVSNARSNAREFGSSSKIDQVDLVHLAKNMGTEEGEKLARAIIDCVKYNRTSSNMTNSYGLSIYFPFRKAHMVDRAVATYEEIGLDEEYSRCIQAFASMEVEGQAMSGGTTSPLSSLIDILGNSDGGTIGNQMLTGVSNIGKEVVGQLLKDFLSGSVQNIVGLTLENTNFLNGRVLNEEEMTEYFNSHSLDAEKLQWTDELGKKVMVLEEEQWKLVQTLYANMFYDDGTGYIDLGLDNVYEFDEKGSLLAPEEETWIAINSQPVAYYHENTVDDGENYSITGRVPVLHNGERAELVLEFTNENPYGSVVGVRRVYIEGETQTLAKTMDAVQAGDVIDFVCDYYSYDGEYLDSYLFGEQLVVDGELEISDVYVDSKAASLTYLFTDIYNQKYWSDPVVFD